MPPSCCGCLSQYTHHHLAVFLLTFFSYVLLHSSRKTFSNVKVSISAQWTPSISNDSAQFSPAETWENNRLFADEKQATLFLGALDSIFLFSYAAGLYLSGVIGDRVNLRYVLCFGLCGSAVVEFVFGTLTEWLHIYNVYLYCGLWVLNGLLQSAVWPCVVAVMGHWFGKTGRGFVFGLWSACASVGNILGAFLASSVLKYGYEYAFLVTSIVQFAGGVVVFFGLLTSPKEVGLSLEEATGLGPVETETDSHKPLMSDEEEEEEQVEAYARTATGHRLLPGLLPARSSALFSGLRLLEAGQLLLLLLASFLSEQQLRVEGGRGRPLVCVVRCRRDYRRNCSGFDLRLYGEEVSSSGHQSCDGHGGAGGIQPITKRSAYQRRHSGCNWLFHWRSVQHDQLSHFCRPGKTGGAEEQSGGPGYRHWDCGWNREHRSGCRTVRGFSDREQAGLDECFLLLRRHDRGQHFLHHAIAHQRN
uniref:Major facilitator superfamily (MFS) profile domain-containing protein n=1 Tax=Oryzias latipes TaxID=8090 RepID=A0A3P9JYB8_ORYLA